MASSSDPMPVTDDPYLSKSIQECRNAGPYDNRAAFLRYQVRKREELAEARRKSARLHPKAGIPRSPEYPRSPPYPGTLPYPRNPIPIGIDFSKTNNKPSTAQGRQSPAVQTADDVSSNATPVNRSRGDSGVGLNTPPRSGQLKGGSSNSSSSSPLSGRAPRPHTPEEYEYMVGPKFNMPTRARSPPKKFRSTRAYTERRRARRNSGYPGHPTPRQREARKRSDVGVDDESNSDYDVPSGPLAVRETSGSNRASRTRKVHFALVPVIIPERSDWSMNDSLNRAETPNFQGKEVDYTGGPFSPPNRPAPTPLVGILKPARPQSNMDSTDIPTHHDPSTPSNSDSNIDSADLISHHSPSTTSTSNFSDQTLLIEAIKTDASANAAAVVNESQGSQEQRDSGRKKQMDSEYIPELDFSAVVAPSNEKKEKRPGKRVRAAQTKCRFLSWLRAMGKGKKRKKGKDVKRGKERVRLSETGEDT